MIKTISLKAKHYYYISTFMRSLSVDGIFDTIYELRTKLSNEEIGDDDLVSADIDLNTVYSMYCTTGGVGHVSAKHINPDMSAMLMPQLLSFKAEAEGVFENDAENEEALALLELIDKFIQVEIDGQAAVDSKIEEGRNWLRRV